MNKFFFSSKILEILPNDVKKKLIYFSLVLFFASLLELFGLSLIIPIVNNILNLGKSFEFLKDFKIVETFLSSTILLVSLFFTFLLLKNIILIFIHSHTYKFLFRTEEKISNTILSNYLKKNYNFFVNNNSSVLVNNLTLEILKINDATLNYLNLICELFFLTGLIILFGIINLKFTIIILTLLILFSTSYIYLFKKKIVKIGSDLILLNDTRFKHLNEIFSNIKNIKVLEKENFFYEKYKDVYSKSIDLRIKNKIIQFIPRLLVEIFVIILLIIGYALMSYFSVDIKSTIPEVGFLVICILRIIPSVNKVITSVQNLNFTERTFENFKTLIENFLSENNFKHSDYKIDLTDKEKLNTLEIKDLSFKYNKKIILESANIKFERGKIYGIFGESGSGKSTFLNILLGLIKANKIKLRYNETDYSSDNQFISLTKKIGFVSQSQTILDDTIKNNIAFGLDDNQINEKIINIICEKTKLSQFIEELPDKINSRIGEFGSKISGGQIQRLLISRALYNNPDILILDEPTSSLDRELEIEIIKTLSNLKKDKIIIFVTHNIKNKEYFDINYKLSDGKFEII